MQQTILALAAILSFAYLAMGRQRHDNDVERQAQSVEAELAAVDVARARMTALERLAFDEDDTGRRGVRTAPSPIALGADAGETGPATYDDVDDWNAAGPLNRTIPVGLDSLTFEVDVAVRYVKDDEPTAAAGGATLTKEILVTVIEIPDGPLDRVPATATLRRVVSPASTASYLQ